MLIDAKLLPLKKRADDGDPVAQVKIADAYYQGNGAPLDYEQAKKYLIKDQQMTPMICHSTVTELCYTPSANSAIIRVK